MKSSNMEYYSTLELNVISAKDIKDVSLLSKMDVYVLVSLSGNNQKAKTNVDREGGTSPSWNFPMKFIIDESALRQNLPTLVFKLRCDRTIGGDKDIGVVYVPIIDLLKSTKNGKSNIQFVSYQVTKPSGKPKGELNFSYKFSGKLEAGGEAQAPKATAREREPVTAYPAVAPVAGPSAPPYDDGLYLASAPPLGSGYSNAPQPPYQPFGSGYPPPPPPPGYGYPPPPPGYGYPPPPGYGYPPPPGFEYPVPHVQQPVPKKSNFGMGLGAGLLGGVLGGLLIGDLV